MKKKILVVVDMQNDFTTGCLGNAECIAAIDGVKEVLASEVYDEYIFTLDTHGENYMDTMEGSKLPVSHCIKGTEGHAVVEGLIDLAKEKSDKVTCFEKITFGSTGLAEYFAKNVAGDNYGKDVQIDFVGVCTGICGISNVMLTKAVCPEATIRVIAKACACVTPDSHKTALDAMAMCHIEIVQVIQIRVIIEIQKENMLKHAEEKL